MNKDEAKIILEQQLTCYKPQSQVALLRLLDEPDNFECVSPSGTSYYLEVQAFWDDESKRELRVAASVDDGGWYAFRPLCDDFIIRSDDSLVDE